MFVFLAAAPAFPAAQRAEPPATRPAGDDPAALVKQLGDSSFKVRSEATRRLCKLGPVARPALEAAARGGDAEVVLRAKALLGLLDELLFAGCTVELAVSKSRIAWDESADLRVTVRNTSDFAAAVPFPGHAPTVGQTGAEHQVAAILDVADFLEIIDAEGNAIPLHVDDLTDDPAVETLVRQRAESPPVGKLAAGATLEHLAAAFNRGWARYGLLRPGTYRLTLTYAPQWDDPEFAEAKVGGLASNTVELTVGPGAPERIVRVGAPPALALADEEGTLIARLHNPSDAGIWVNLNLGPGGPPLASFAWVVWVREEWQDAVPSPSSASRFERSGLREVPAGGTLEVARATHAEVRRLAGLADGAVLRVRAKYTNFCNAGWQRGQNGELPAELKEPLPPRLVATSLVAEPLKMD